MAVGGSCGAEEPNIIDCSGADCDWLIGAANAKLFAELAFALGVYADGGDGGGG